LYIIEKVRWKVSGGWGLPYFVFWGGGGGREVLRS